MVQQRSVRGHTRRSGDGELILPPEHHAALLTAGPNADGGALPLGRADRERDDGDPRQAVTITGRGAAGE